jgi:hypothetical protein
MINCLGCMARVEAQAGNVANADKAPEMHLYTRGKQSKVVHVLLEI